MKRAKKVVFEALDDAGHDIEYIDEQMLMDEHLSMTSLEVADLLSEIENKLENTISFSDYDVWNLKTVDDVITRTHEKMNLKDD